MNPGTEPDGAVAMLSGKPLEASVGLAACSVPVRSVAGGTDGITCSAAISACEDASLTAVITYSTAIGASENSMVPGQRKQLQVERNAG